MSAKNLTINVISPEKVLYTGEGSALKIPGVDGYFGVLLNHAALVSELGIGVLEIESGGKTNKMVVEGGFVQINSNVVNVLTKGGDTKESINLDKVKFELTQLMNSKDKNRDIEIQKAKARISLFKTN
ncbi:MAG TPA: ATP synthase F1 subunit epsilon [Leptospiraceae bacterium]|nr:ATP synthase F1 subunit epsilon [Leptospiraceae bacterium]